MRKARSAGPPGSRTCLQPPVELRLTRVGGRARPIEVRRLRADTHDRDSTGEAPRIKHLVRRRSPGGEIGDAAISNNQQQTAWVSGVHVQAYWSNQYGATVIPIDRDYQARINGAIKPDKRTVENGTFRSDPEDSRLCDILPQCCLAQKDYKYTIVHRDEIVRLRIETQRYRTPVLAWTVEGQPVTSNTTLSVDVLAGTFTKQHPHFVNKTISVQCELQNNEIVLHTVGTAANFDLTVGCSVTDGSFVGNIRSNVIAKPSLDIGFVGAELTVDPDYEHQRSECSKAAAKMFKNISQTSAKVKIGDPVEFSPTVLAELPAYARVDQYQRARWAIALSRAASLLRDVPALQAAIAANAKRGERSEIATSQLEEPQWSLSILPAPSTYQD